MYISFETNIRISNFVFEYSSIRLSPSDNMVFSLYGLVCIVCITVVVRTLLLLLAVATGR